MEVIAVMIILVIILVIVIGAATYYAQSGQTSEQLKEQRERAQRAAQTLRTRTELHCPQHITDTALCIDGIRAMSTKRLITQNESLEQRYFDLFGSVTLTVNPIHPPLDPVTIYNETPSDTTNLSRQTMQTPILYYNATTKTKHFAILSTTLYQ